MSQIIIICAIAQEVRPILKLFRSTRIVSSTDTCGWHFKAFGNDITLLQSGMGGTNAARAATAAAALGAEVIISAGFCGALSYGVDIGEVFLAEKLFNYSSNLLSPATIPDQELGSLIAKWIKKGNFITTAEIVEKTHVFSLLPEQEAVNLLDMESAVIAEVCHNYGIRFAAIRSVSDSANQDPARVFRHISDNDFNISLKKVTLTLLKKQSTLKELLQLRRNSVNAGKTLSVAIANTLEHI
jgi:adenosylhomocysteine nucleosidase